MPLDTSLAQLMSEMFAPMGRITIRKMFSGGGIYCDGLMFGLIARDSVYLKSDAGSRHRFEFEGMGPFVFQGRGKTVVLSYWRMPERLFDDAEEALDWGREAMRAARMAAVAKAKKKPRGSR